MSTPFSTSTIVSQAFRMMEVTPPSSLSDGSKKALAASEQYAVALGICLEQEDFSFARRFVTLPVVELPSSESADPDLPYLHALPDDLVKLRSVFGTGVVWRLDQDFMRTNINQPISILYTRVIKNESRLPSLFKTAVSYQLAVLLSPEFVSSRTKRADLAAEGAAAMDRAIRNDAVSASHVRWDGRTDQGDWASGAVK